MIWCSSPFSLRSMVMVNVDLRKLTPSPKYVSRPTNNLLKRYYQGPIKEEKLYLKHPLGRIKCIESACNQNKSFQNWSTIQLADHSIEVYFTVFSKYFPYISLLSENCPFLQITCQIASASLAARHFYALLHLHTSPIFYWIGSWNFSFCRTPIEGPT